MVNQSSYLLVHSLGLNWQFLLFKFLPELLGVVTVALVVTGVIVVVAQAASLCGIMPFVLVSVDGLFCFGRTW